MKQKLPWTAAARRRLAESKDEGGGKPPQSKLPKPRSQSGRRLFVVTTTETGDELLLEMRGKFKRWILRADRDGAPQLIAMPAGDFKVDEEYYRGEVPAEWRKRVRIEDAGAYELIDGSYQRRRFDLYFSGKTLQGEWLLEKTSDETHRSWSLTPLQA